MRPRTPPRRACATVNLPGNSESKRSLLLGKRHDRGRPSGKVRRLRRQDGDASRPQLRTVVDQPKTRSFLVSPYFVPGKKGVEPGRRAPARRASVVIHQFAGFHRRGAGPLHMPALPQALLGPASNSTRSSRPRRPTQAATSRTGRTEPSAACTRRRSPSTAGLVFIGSYNLDPALEQTEHGDGRALRLSAAREASARGSSTPRCPESRTRCGWRRTGGARLDRADRRWRARLRHRARRRAGRCAWVSRCCRYCRSSGCSSRWTAPDSCADATFLSTIRARLPRRFGVLPRRNRLPIPIGDTRDQISRRHGVAVLVRPRRGRRPARVRGGAPAAGKGARSEGRRDLHLPSPQDQGRRDLGGRQQGAGQDRRRRDHR